MIYPRKCKYKMTKVSFLILTIASFSECANILAVFPTPSISHQIVFRPLINELVKRGHQLTVITTDPEFTKDKRPGNLTEIDVHDLSYGIWEKFLIAAKGQETHAKENIKLIFQLLNNVFEEQLKSNEVQKLIMNKNKNFDLLFVEACVRPAIVFSHIYKVPVIEISSFGGLFETFDTTGAPINPLIYPLPTRQKLNNLTAWEKISELRINYFEERIYSDLINSENEMLKKIFGPDTPDIKELKKNIHMLFLNVHPVWDFNRPVPPNILYLGGLHQKPLRKLPQELQSYLDSSKNGVIYMSFGTNVKPSLLPPEKIQIFANVFSKLPYNVLWKWNTDDSPGRSDNVKISKWFPQSDLLKHPNVKVFITQGGLQSTDEAITAGVPLIGVPMLGDQWFNVEQYIRLSIGIKLSIQTITEDSLRDAIETVIKDESYRQNIIKLQSIMKDQPLPPLERAVWWTEYVIRHGGAKHLQTAAAHMEWTEYYAMDLVLLVLIIFIIIGAITILSVRLVLSKVNITPFKTKLQ